MLRTARRAFVMLGILAVLALTTPAPASASPTIYDVNIAPVGGYIKVTTHSGFIIYLKNMAAQADVPLVVYDQAGNVVMASRYILFESDGDGRVTITDMTATSPLAGKRNVCGFNMGAGTTTTGNINT
jgi:hypothetical protein